MVFGSVRLRFILLMNVKQHQCYSRSCTCVLTLRRFYIRRVRSLGLKHGIGGFSGLWTDFSVKNLRKSV